MQYNDNPAGQLARGVFRFECKITIVLQKYLLFGDIPVIISRGNTKFDIGGKLYVR